MFRGNCFVNKEGRPTAGRRILWAWIFDGPGFRMRAHYGWSGTMGLPRVLSLGTDRRLHRNPPEEIERLRFNGRRAQDFTVSADSECVLVGFGRNSIEVDLEMNSGDARQLGVKVCCSPGGEEQATVCDDATDKKLKVDTTRSSLSEGPKIVEAGPFELQAGEALRLRVFAALPLDALHR